jgi:hypothetical protein
MAAAPVNRPPQRSASDNPMLASMLTPPTTAMASMSTPTVPIASGPSMMPAAVGIGSLPMGSQPPMSSDTMFAGMSPDQSNMVNQYLRSRNMVGFA